LKVVDIETGELLGPGQQGELCVSGPQVMLGYYKNQAATDETLMEGWLHTGDIAVSDSTGQFTIVDRLKELIKVGIYKKYNPVCLICCAGEGAAGVA
jgi:long-subunit acyl-CoA synthetase (AMP-forming)